MRLMSLLATTFTLGSYTAVASEFPVTVRSCDSSISFSKPPTRAVSNDINLTEMMLALGLSDHMAGFTGVSAWKTLDAQLRSSAKELPELSPDYPTKEVLLGANADFYFAGWNYGLEVGGEVTPETLAPFGIKVYELTESCIHVMKRPKSSMEDMYNDILNLGKIFGVTEKAEALVAQYRQELADIKATLPRRAVPVKVFVYDSGQDKPFTAGKYAMPTALIEAAGGINVMDDVEQSWGDVGWEVVIARNPEVIAIVDYGDVTAAQKEAFLLGNSAFKDIRAIRNRRFVVLPYVEATPGPRNISAIRALAAEISKQ